MFLNDINPFVRYAAIGGVGNNYYSDKETFTWLQTPDCRLFYILGGHGKIIVNDKSYQLVPCSCILFQSGSKYRWDTKKVDIISINFDYTNTYAHLDSPFYPTRVKNSKNLNILEKIYFDNASVLNDVLYLPDASHIEYFLRLLTSSFWTEDKYIKELLSSYMKSIVISIVHSIHNNNNNNTAIVNKIIQYIQNNYASNLTNEKIGEITHFNSAYINRIFKEHTGTTIHNFIVNYRIKIAQELLRTQKSTVNAICFNVGFNDISHFTKSFKQYTNMTPTEYRKSQISVQQ